MNTKNAIKNVADVPNKFDKSGGNVTGNITLPNDTAITWNRNTDYAKIRFKNTADSDTDSYMLFETGDNGNEYFKFASTSGSTSTDWLTIKSDHLRFKGNAVYHTGNKPTASDVGALASNGTAVAATKLATARTINGTSFDGSANITTSNWGTARTLTIGNAGKSVNGSGNISWSLSEIGAAASSHTHSYLPLSGGELTGSLTLANSAGLALKNSSNVSTTIAIMNSKNQIVLGSLNNSMLLFGSQTPVYCPNASTGYALYHEGNRPTPASIGAIPSSKITISQTAPSNPSTGDLWISW